MSQPERVFTRNVTYELVRSDEILASLVYVFCTWMVGYARAAHVSIGLRCTLNKQTLEETRNIPIKVLMPQCGTVGVNSTVTRSGTLLSNVICGAETTASCSRVMLRCSGSDIDLMRSEQ